MALLPPLLLLLLPYLAQHVAKRAAPVDNRPCWPAGWLEAHTLAWDEMLPLLQHAGRYCCL